MIQTLMEISFLNQGIDYPIPQALIDDSLTLADMLRDTDGYQDKLEIECSLSVESLQAMSAIHSNDQIILLAYPYLVVILPVLSFLNCERLFQAAASRIIDSEGILTFTTRRLISVDQYLSYRAVLKRLMTCDEAPRYSHSMCISQEEWYEYIDLNVNRLINLINRGFPLDVLLGELPHLRILDVVAAYRMGNNPDRNEITLLLSELLSNLELIDNRYLENILRHIPISPVMNRIFQVREIESIRRLGSEGCLRPVDLKELVSQAIYQRDDELVDVLIELQDHYSDSSIHLPFFQPISVVQGIEAGYLYHLKYIDNISIPSIPEKTRSRKINLSEDQFRWLISQLNEVDSYSNLVTLICLGSRRDLIEIMFKNLPEYEDLIRIGIYKSLPLTEYTSVQEYEFMTGREFKVSLTIIGAASIHDSLGGITSNLLKLLTDENIYDILYIGLSQDLHPRNIQLVKWLLNRSKPEEFQRIIRDRINQWVKKSSTEIREAIEELKTNEDIDVWKDIISIVSIGLIVSDYRINIISPSEPSNIIDLKDKIIREDPIEMEIRGIINPYRDYAISYVREHQGCRMV